MTIVVQAPTAYSPSIMNWVIPDVPMAPLDLVTNAIRDSAIELCERALVWRTELQQILVLAPVSTTTSAASAQYATTITVDSITNLNDEDTIKVELDDGTFWRGHIDGTPSGSTVTLDGQLNEAVESGAAVTKFVDLYAVTYPSGATMAKGLNAWFNDSWLEPISQDDLNDTLNGPYFRWSNDNWRTDLQIPTRWYFSDDNTVGLAMPPDGTGNLRIEAALKPTRASTTLPTVLWERYIEVIAHGAKGRLMLVAKKPYTDLKLGQWHMQEFHSGISDAMIGVAKARTRAPLRSHTVYGLH